MIKPITRFIKRKYRQRKLKKLRKKQKGVPLREFVYLDEVSIYSLFASRFGAVAAEYNDAKTKSLQLDTSLLAGTGEKNTNKKEAKVGAMFNYGQNTQVLRKATIQSTYKEFYDLEKDTLILKKEYENTNDLFKNFNQLIKDKNIQHNSNIKSVDYIQRGDLVEVEVELDAEHIYKANTIFNILIEMLNEDSNLVDIKDSKEFSQFKEINNILSQLLSGLIPVKCKVLNYRLLEKDEKQYIVHSELLNKLSDINIETDTSSFYIVGVIDKNLFWKDIRRILFDNDRYHLLCRISKPAITNSWTSVKSMAVLKEIAPEISQLIESNKQNIFRYSFNNLNNETTMNNHNEAEIFKRILFYYGIIIIENKYLTCDNNIKSRLLEIAEENKHLSTRHEDRLSSFKKISDFIASLDSNIEFDSEDLVIFRELAIQKANGESIQHKQKNNPSQIPKNSENDEYYLESEIIAIYW